MADRVIRISPSGDGYLALAVLRKLYEIDAIPFSARDRVDNIEEFENFLFSEDLTVEKCALHAGSVPMEDIEYLADIYSKKSPVATWIGWG